MRTQNPRFRLAATVAVTALLLSQVIPQPAMAQGAPPPPAGAQDQQVRDPPTRVGRLAQVSGTVSFHAQDEDRWNPATLNFPVVQGNAFWTEPNAQAVIEVSASRIAMAPGTELEVATLTDAAFQATEAQGELYLRIRAATPDESYAVQTPRGLVTLTAPGRYAIVAGDTQNPTTVTVIEGSARVEGPGVSLDLGANQTANITGGDTFQAEVGPAQRDGFLTAMLAGERPPQPRGVAPPPVVAAMPGGDDLAQYGSWSDSPQYGQVWYPQVAQDWVPYREGRWAYVAPWGWTWVDSAPWGFAPFHYGRWIEADGRWGWLPGGWGPPRPVYAPALVTFLGVGAVAGIGIGAALAGGQIGWLPLGPREPFHPWYRASDRHFRQVNVANVTNFTTINRNVTINNFANRRAATVVPTSAMTASRPVGTAFQRVDPAQLAQARPVFGQQPLRPAPTTVGVTPVVARQLGLPPPSPSLRTVAPGPTLRAAPAGVSTGVAAGTVAGTPGMPTLHNPAQPNLPAVAGSARPFTATPALRVPAPGQIGPPSIQREPGFAGQGAGSQVPPLVNHGSGGATPAIVTRESPPQLQRAPGAAFQQTIPPAAPQASPTAPSVVGRPPAPLMNTAPTTTAPSPAIRAPLSPSVEHMPPGAVRPPTPPVVANAPPAQVFHAPPPVVARPPPPVVANAPPAQVFHPPPPAVARPPPPPVVASAPPAQVFHPPPPVMNTAPPVVRAAPNPPPQVHAPAPPPQAAPRPPPQLQQQPQQQQNARQKRPGEP